MPGTKLEQASLTREELLDQLPDWSVESQYPSAKLEIPDHVLPVFVPEIVYELAENPDNVRIVRKPYLYGTVAFAVVESHYPHRLTDPDAWKAYTDDPFGVTPPGINYFHLYHEEMVSRGLLALDDRVMMYLRMAPVRKSPQVLYIFDFDGEARKGIGTEFYTRTLPPAARKMGFRFITGLNNPRNLSFYVNRVGRYPITSIKPEFLPLLFPNTIQSGEHKYTVQFLYPEDEEQMVEGFRPFSQ